MKTILSLLQLVIAISFITVYSPAGAGVLQSVN
jgi:hypothetical protein